MKNGNGTPDSKINQLIHEFATACQPTETEERLLHLSDSKTGAHYCECHIKGSKLVSLGTTAVLLPVTKTEGSNSDRTA